MCIRDRRQDGTNTLINAGTSAGVILSGPVALMFGAEWRLAYGVFAAAACVLAVLAILHVPRTAAPPVQAHAGAALFSRCV